MATAKHVLTVDYWYRDEEGEAATYRRGDEVELNEREVKFLTRAGAIAKPSSDEAKRAQESAPAPTVQPGSVIPDGYNQSTYGTLAANSGLGPSDASGGELSEEQWDEELALAEQRSAGPAGSAPPAKSATVDEWRRWAVASGKMSADDAEQANKGDIQALAK